MVDFSGASTELLLNPRMPEDERARLERLFRSVPALAGHFWLATSGTTGSIKLVALSNEAILASAAAVNAHLDAQPKDVWCCVLPEFHVGGLGIHARAFLTGSRVVSAGWQPAQFAEGGFTLSSLVPAQVRDLVQAGLRSPHELRAVVVGGGPLSDNLYAAAADLGWPLLPSYGLTEAASQVATAAPGSPRLRILPHLDLRIVDGHIELRGPSMLTGLATLDERDRPLFHDPKVDGWLRTEDQGEVRDGELHVLGRSGDFVKIGGESVDLLRLDRVLEEVRGRADVALVAVTDERLGCVIHIATASADVSEVVGAFNERVLPFERIRAVRQVPEIPRTALGKVRRAELLGMLS